MSTFRPAALIAEEHRFRAAFHERTLERFSHRDHLRLAWLVMKEHGLQDGLNLMRQEIRRFAEDQGSGSRYHETLTVFWSRMVHHAIENAPDTGDFEALLSAYPFLMDKGLPLRHWSSERLWSDSARTGWMDPDLSPLFWNT